MAFFKKKTDSFKTIEQADGLEARTYGTANHEVSALVGRNSDDTKIIDVAFEDGDTASYVISQSNLKIILTQEGQWLSLEDRLILEGSSAADAKRVAQLERMNLWKEFHDVLIQEAGEERAHLYFEHLIEQQMLDFEMKKVTSIITDFIVDDIEETVPFWDRPAIPAHELTRVIEELQRQDTALLRALTDDKSPEEVKFNYVSASSDPRDVFIGTIFSTMETSSMTLQELLHHTKTAYPRYFVLRRIMEMQDNGHFVYVEDQDFDALPDVIEEAEADLVEEEQVVEDQVEGGFSDFFVSTATEEEIEESLSFPTNSLRSVREDYRDQSTDPLVISHEWDSLVELEQKIQKLEDDLVVKAEAYMGSMSDHIYNSQIDPDSGKSNDANRVRDGIAHLFFDIERIEKERDDLNLHRRAMLDRAVSPEDNSIAVSKRIQDIEGISYVALRTEQEDKDILAQAPPETIFDINEYNEDNVPIFYKVSRMMNLNPFEGVYQ